MTMSAIKTTVSNTTHSLADAKAIVNAVDRFLHHGARSKYKTVAEAALALKQIWEQLEFAYSVANAWQDVGLLHLGRVVSGEYTGFNAEDNLHGVNGMFNQTCRDALNLVQEN